MRHLILTCCVITCLNSFSAIAQTYYADTVAGPTPIGPREFSRQTPPAPTFLCLILTLWNRRGIPNLPHNHGATVHADGTFYYFTNTSKPSMSSIPGPLRLSIAFSWPTAPIISPQACELERSTSP